MDKKVQIRKKEKKNQTKSRARINQKIAMMYFM